MSNAQTKRLDDLADALHEHFMLAAIGPMGCDCAKSSGEEHVAAFALDHLASRPVTDEEVEAGAIAAFLSTGPAEANGFLGEWANADDSQRERWRTRASAALEAARSARAGQ